MCLSIWEYSYQRYMLTVHVSEVSSAPHLMSSELSSDRQFKEAKSVN